MADVPHIWRANFETPLGSPASVQGYGETAIGRMYESVMYESVETPYGKVTFAALVTAIPKFLERWAVEDREMLASLSTGELVPEPVSEPEPVKPKENDPYEQTPKPKAKRRGR